VGAPSGWDLCVRQLEEVRIPEGARRWYVVRAQAFVEAMRPKRLGELTADRPLLKQMAQVLRANHYALRTEQTYVDWCYRFVRYLEGDSRHTPGDYSNIGKAEVQRFLTHLAVDRQVSASTQNQALNALVFLFRQVPERPLDEMSFGRAQAYRWC
jgi:hypothetical protein